MRITAPQIQGECPSTARSPLNFLRRHEDGTTAIEFAIVAVPFFMFIFGLMAVSTYFFMMTSLEKGMDQASRLIRTGQAQTDGMTVKDFKNTVCLKANSKSAPTTDEAKKDPASYSGWVKCSDVQVFVQTFPSWDAVVPSNCVNNSQAVVSTAKDSDPIADYAGESNAIVLVTTCYKWKFAGKIPYIDLGQMSDGSMMMQSATAFRTEPYATN